MTAAQRYTFHLTEAEYERLLLALGMAAGAAARDGLPGRGFMSLAYRLRKQLEERERQPAPEEVP